ncbi:MAG: hypothetical protein ACQETD_02255 [Pseudomonadota bacterium]
MARQDTRLESEGAEFLVLGQLLLHKVAAYKTYTNMPGYDLVATSPENNTSARIQVKSRWATKAGGFPIKNFECDFVVVVLLNRGSKDGKKEVLPPEYFVIPVDVVKKVCRTNTSWSKVMLNDVENLDSYRGNWGLVGGCLSA